MGKRRAKEVRSATVYGRRLGELRTAAGITRYALSKLAEVDPTYLGHLERGAKSPGWDVACRIADALGCSLDDFRG